MENKKIVQWFKYTSIAKYKKMGSLNKNIWWCFVKFFLGSLYRSIILRNTSIQNQKLYQTQWFKDTLIDKIEKWVVWVKICTNYIIKYLIGILSPKDIYYFNSYKYVIKKQTPIYFIKKLNSLENGSMVQIYISCKI